MSALMKIKHDGAGMFEFSNDVPIDIEHTLDQLLGRFAQVRDGLPELVKNSKDQYLRLGIDDHSDRQIAILIDTKNRKLGVLDFAGAKAEDFEHWKIWSGKQGARQSLADQIEAGHGNGGKAFMVRGASKTATMESCCDGKYTRMGYQNDDSAVRYKPGFGVENGVRLDNIAESSPTNRLDQFLHNFNLAVGGLPSAVQAAFLKRKAFTAITVDQVAEWIKARIDGMDTRVSRLADLIMDHGQTALTLETCDVWLIVDGSPIKGGPLQISGLDPYPGFEQPLEIAIPDILTDPSTKESVTISLPTQSSGKLRLETTKSNLSLSEDLKARNVLRLWNSRNNVANWPLPALGLAMPAVYFIGGRLDCPALIDEHLLGADRNYLADTPLVRALEAWVVDQVKDLAIKIQQAQATETAPQEQERARKALKAFRDLMRDFLDQRDASGDDANEGAGSKRGNKGQGDRDVREKRPFGSRIDRVILERGKLELSVASGTKIPLIIACFEDQSDGTSKPVKPDDLVAKCDTTAVGHQHPEALPGDASGNGRLGHRQDDRVLRRRRRRGIWHMINRRACRK